MRISHNSDFNLNFILIIATLFLISATFNITQLSLYFAMHHNFDFKSHCLLIANNCGLHLTNESLFFRIVTISHSLVFLFFTLRQKQAFLLCRYISNRKSVFRRLVSVACVFSLNSLSNSRSSTLLGTNMKPIQDSPVTRFIAIQHCSQSITFMWSSYRQRRKEKMYFAYTVL